MDRSRGLGLILALAAIAVAGLAAPSTATDAPWTFDVEGALDLNHTAGVSTNATDTGKFGTGVNLVEDAECAQTVETTEAWLGPDGSEHDQHEVLVMAAFEVQEIPDAAERTIVEVDASGGSQYLQIQLSPTGEIQFESFAGYGGDNPYDTFSVSPGDKVSLRMNVEAYLNPSDINVGTEAWKKGQGRVSDGSVNANLQANDLAHEVFVAFGGEAGGDDQISCNAPEVNMLEGRFWGDNGDGTIGSIDSALLNWTDSTGENGEPVGKEDHIWMFEQEPAPAHLLDETNNNHDLRESSDSSNTPVERNNPVQKYGNGTWGGATANDWSVFMADDPAMPTEADVTELTIGYAFEVDLDQGAFFLSEFDSDDGAVTPFMVELGANAYKNDVRIWLEECDGTPRDLVFSDLVVDEQLQTLTIQLREDESNGDVSVDVRKDGGETTSARLTQDFDVCWEKAASYDHLNVPGTIYEERLWSDTVVSNSELDAWASQDDEKYTQRLKGDETAAWFYEESTSDTENETESGGDTSEDPSTGDNEDPESQPLAAGLRTDWTNDPRVVAYVAEPGGQGALNIYDSDLQKQNEFTSCHAVDQDDTQTTRGLAVTYDNWILTLCQDETDTSYSLESYSFSDGTVGSLSFTTCNDEVPHSLGATVLDRVLWMDEHGCRYRADAVQDDVTRAPGSSSDQVIRVSHETEAADQFVAVLDRGTPTSWAVLEEVGGQTLVERETEARAIEIHNLTVWTLNENEDLRRWQGWRNATGEPQFPETPNATVATGLTPKFGAMKLSKDGRYVMTHHGSVGKLWFADPFEDLERVTTPDPIHELDMDRCNNRLYGLDEGREAHLWQVSDVTNSTAGDGDPNPCPGEDEGPTQSTEDSSGDPSQTQTGETDDDVDGGDTGPSDGTTGGGLAGNATFQSIGDALGVDADGARLLWAGLMMAALGVTFATVAGGTATGLGVGAGEAAVAGVATGGIVSLGLGLLPVWVFVLAGVVAVAFMLWGD